MTSQSKDGIEKLATNRYRIRVRVTCPRTDERKEVDRVRSCTLTEARALQRQWRDELTNALTQDKGKRIRLGDFVESWLSGRKGKIKRSTAQKIVDVWEGHVANDTLARLYVDDIQTEDIERWIEGMHRKTYVPGKGKASKRATRSAKSEPRHYSQETLRGYDRVLRQIIGVACARLRLPSPYDAVEPLKPGKRRKNVLAPAEVKGVLAHVEANAPFWYPAVLLDVVGGLRWGELSALKWEDVDEVRGVVRVVRGQYKGVLNSSTKTGNDEDCPKVVPLLPAVAEALRAHRQRMIRDQHPGLAAGWIFPTERGTLHKGSPLRDVLDAACAACGTKQRVTPHGLRHTANDLLRRVAEGEVVRAIIGHSTPQMTSHYSHVDEIEKLHAMARSFEAVLGAGGNAGGIAGAAGAAGIAQDTPKSERAGDVAGSFSGGATQI